MDHLFMSLFWFGPSMLLGILGLVFTFFRRGKWVGLVMAIAGCGFASWIEMAGGNPDWMRKIEWLCIVLFEEWGDADAYFVKASFVFGIITAARVYSLCRKEKKQRQQRAAMEGYETKVREL